MSRRFEGRVEHAGDLVPGQVRRGDRGTRRHTSGREAIQEPDDGGSGSSQAHVLAKMDPFSADYRAGVLDLYATLRTRVGDTGYVAERDEASERVATSRPTHGPGWYRGASGT